MTRPSGSTGEVTHIVYYDWLKFLVVYGIVVFHASLAFSAGRWLIKSHDHSLILGAFAQFTFPWGIPLLFLLSGAGAYFGLRSKPAGAFLRKRFLRLGLPFVVGLVVLSPLQSYFAFRGGPASVDGLTDHYPDFLTSIRLSWTPEWFGHYGYHLWFLGDLLAITAITLPLLEWLRGEQGRRGIAWLARLGQRRGGIFVFAAPMALSQMLLRNHFPVYEDWADVATYTLMFLAGYVLAANTEFNTAIRRSGAPALILGVVSLILWSMPFIPDHDHVVHNTLWSLNIWCWSITVLYIGVRWLKTSNRVMSYGSESAIAVYLIHHPVVVILGSYIVAWNLPLWPRFLLLTGLAFTVTVAIYEFGVRRWNATRFLFGLAPAARRVSIDCDSAGEPDRRRSGGSAKWRPAHVALSSQVQWPSRLHVRRL